MILECVCDHVRASFYTCCGHLFEYTLSLSSRHGVSVYVCMYVCVYRPRRDDVSRNSCNTTHIRSFLVHDISMQYIHLNAPLANMRTCANFHRSADMALITWRLGYYACMYLHTRTHGCRHGLTLTAVGISSLSAAWWSKNWRE